MVKTEKRVGRYSTQREQDGQERLLLGYGLALSRLNLPPSMGLQKLTVHEGIRIRPEGTRFFFGVELWERLVRPAGIEPATTSLEGWGSLQLSYGRVYRAALSWSGREDLNLRRPAPKAGALPDCATPRHHLARIKALALAKARPRWLMRFFSAGVSSASVFPTSGT